MKVYELIERLREFNPEDEVEVWTDQADHSDTLDITDIEYADDGDTVIIEVA